MCMTQMPKITGEAGDTSRSRQDKPSTSHCYSISRLNFKTAVSQKSFAQFLPQISVGKAPTGNRNKNRWYDIQVNLYAYFNWYSTGSFSSVTFPSLPARMFPCKLADLQQRIVGWISSASFILQLSVPLSPTLLAALFITCNHNNWSFLFAKWK